MKDQIAHAFPYFMVLTSMFIGGAVFVFINGPLAWEIMAPNHSSDVPANTSGVAHMVQQVLVPSWKALSSQSDKFSSLSFTAFACFVVGLVFHGMTAAHACFWAFLGNWKAGQRCYFSVGVCKWHDHPKMAVGMQKTPDLKREWEWILFLYYLYWGIAANAFWFLMFSLILAWPDPWLIGILAVYGGATVRAFQFSRIMYTTHCYVRESLGLGSPHAGAYVGATRTPRIRQNGSVSTGRRW